MDVLLLVLGLVVLVFGGDYLVRGAVGFASTMKLSPLVVGMTVVAFGTSAPEFIVSVQSAIDGAPGIAIGNVVGSNIANIALVLGVTVMIFPIVVDRQTKAVDFPMMIFATVIFFIFAKDGEIAFYEGIVLFAIIIFYTVFLIRYARNKSISEGNKDWEDEMKTPSYWRSLLFLTIGLVGLYFGSEWFVDGAVGLANILLADDPNRETIIGVTVVAFGTSTPELVASTVAAYRKQSDISVGNLIGSNIFNIFSVIGITAMVKPIPVTDQMLDFDMVWMLAVALLLLFVIAIGKKMGKIKGIILFSTYVAYIVMILLKVKGVI